MTRHRPFIYRAVITAWHDADTLTATFDLDAGSHRNDTDLGFHITVAGDRLYYHHPVRIHGCNAPELATPEGKAALAAASAHAPVGTVLVVATHLDQADKYGRVLGTITLPDGSDLTAWLIAGGWAAPWDGRGPKPLPTPVGAPGTPAA